MALLCLLFVYTATVQFGPAQAQPSTDLNQLLDEADRIKSANPERFAQLVSQLEARRGEFDSQGGLFLDYLAGYAHAFNGDLDSAIAKYQGVYDSDAAPHLRYRVAYSIANLLAAQGRIEEGFPYLDSVLHWEPEIADLDLKQRGLQVAVIFYNLAGLYDLGLGTADRLLMQPMEGRNACVARMAWAESLLHLNRLGEHRDQILQGLDYCLEIGEILAASFIRIYVAKQDLAESNPTAALDRLNEGLSAVESTNYARAIGEYYAVIARALYDTSDLDGAIDFANRALETIGPDGYSVPHVSAWETLWKIATSQGDPAKALEYHLRYSAADRARLDDITAKSLAYHTSRHQSLQRISEIEILNKQNEVLRLERTLTQEESVYAQRITVLLGVLLLVAAGWAWRAVRDRKKLKYLAEYDDLTSVLNRRSFTEQTEHLLSQCEMQKQPLALILLDLDLFKQVNDTFGHLSGDCALRKVAEVCRSLQRGMDVVGRIGGEEFAITLPGCSAEDAEHFAERCRRTIAAVDTTECGHVFHVSASFGVADTRECGYDIKTLLSAADDAMYQSKKAGRDRVTVFHEAA